MSSASNYLESAIGNHVLRNVALTSPATVFCALFVSGLDETGAGTEVAGGSYARQAISFTETSNGVFENLSISFTDMPATDVTGLAIFDAVSGGNMLYWDTFSTVSVAAGATYPVDGGTVVITHT